MMMNLFSMFDPSNYLLVFSPWFLVVVILLAISRSIYSFKSSLLVKIIFTLSKEFKVLMSSKDKLSSVNFIGNIFLFVWLLNFLSLFPYVFCLTAHISFSLFMSMSLWFLSMIFYTLKNFKNLMVHLTPQGTPYSLINFMVLIELTSSIIRPITLSVRLSANMVAGHLLMSLLSGFCTMSKTNSFFLPLMLILSSLELAVSMIQAYVFSTLITLYSSEI